MGLEISVPSHPLIPLLDGMPGRSGERRGCPAYLLTGLGYSPSCT